MVDAEGIHASLATTLIWRYWTACLAVLEGMAEHSTLHPQPGHGALWMLLRFILTQLLRPRDMPCFVALIKPQYRVIRYTLSMG